MWSSIAVQLGGNAGTGQQTANRAGAAAQDTYNQGAQAGREAYDSTARNAQGAQRTAANNAQGFAAQAQGTPLVVLKLVSSPEPWLECECLHCTARNFEDALSCTVLFCLHASSVDSLWL